MQHKQTSATEAHFETALAGYTRRARPARRGAGEIVGYTAAAGGLAFAGGDAMGAIVHNTTPETFSVSDSNNTFFVDIDNDQNNDLGLFLRGLEKSTYYLDFLALFNVLNAKGSVLADTSSYALNLSKGAAVGKISSISSQFGYGLLASQYRYFYIDSSNQTSTSVLKEYGDFVNTTGYIGFRFADATPSLKYGWMQLRVDFDAQTPKATVTLYEWAYDDTGAAINVGDTGGGGGSNSVASPATPLLTLLGLGAMGLTHYRRRRSDGLQQMVAQTGVAAEGASTAA